MTSRTSQDRLALARRLDYALKDVELAIMTGRDFKVDGAVDHLRVVVDDVNNVLTGM